ncbi:MAG: hypothetical protein IKD20_05915 [Clostridia bacterium]|nr:hypothetical protein [Clostridia bacterium]
MANEIVRIDESKYRAIGEQNPTIKWVKSLIINSKPNPDRLFVAEGIFTHKLILDNAVKVRAFVICREFMHTAEVASVAEQISSISPECYEVSAKTFLKLSEREKPDGLLCVAQLPVYRVEDFRPQSDGVVLVLDGVEIPGNIGTMVRMADGAGVEAVFICNRKARLTHPKLIKGSLGAILTVPIYEFDSVQECYSLLNRYGYTTYLADTRAERFYYEESFEGPTTFVMGSERYGISRQWYEYPLALTAIPMLGKCDSLNVGVAATVLVYEAVSKKLMRRD